jgi:hypothetical protein|tara:strand:+ start:768 stop:1187 length:420 start_codon:yes stop_codon:yes gene_type:complete
MNDLEDELVLQKVAHRLLENPKENIRSSVLMDYVCNLAGCSRSKAGKVISEARKLISKDLAEIRDEQEAIIINKAWAIHDSAMENKDYRAAIQSLKLLVNVLGLERKALDINLNNTPTGLEDIETTVLLKSVGYEEEAS